MLRNLMLTMAASPRLVSMFAWVGRRYGLSARFIAGESFSESVSAVHELEAQGIRTTLDLLGEGVTRASEAEAATEAYVELLRDIESSELDSTISIKPTQLGLDINHDVCSNNLKSILDEAEKLGNFVRIDMESSAYTGATVRLFKEHYERYGPKRVGIVIQSYLYRSEQDVRELTQMGCNIRLCKGAYMEPESVAFPKKEDVDESFKRLTRIMLESRSFAAIATHDDFMIRHAQQLVQDLGVGEDRYEFQMLYGVRREKQIALRQQGYPMKVYVPFGTQWAPYFIRRLAERPANLLFVAKNFFKA